MASYEKRPSGLWSVRFRISNDDGSYSTKRLSGFKTKRDAQYAFEDYLKDEHARRELKKEQNSAPEIVALLWDFETMVMKYFEFKSTRLKNSSYYDMQQKIKAKILPYFGKYKMKDITPAVVMSWLATLSDYSYCYQKSLFIALSGIYTFAEKYYNIPNVIRKTDRPRNLGPKKEMQIYTPEEFGKVISCVEKYEHAMYLKFLYYSGCRRGEGLGITWDDIDFSEGTVNICKSITHKGVHKGKSYHITTPKNMDSNRRIPLPRFFLDELKEYKNWQIQNFDVINFVFCGEDPLPPTTIARVLQNAAIKAGIKMIRIHDLRHSAASLLIHRGISIVAVSRRLGHKNTEETLNTYSHLLPDDQTLILNVLDSLGSSNLVT